MKLTINQIAELAQVAKSTVSKALNGQKGVSDSKRRQILALADELNFHPNANAQALAFNRSGTIGLVLPHEAGFTMSGAYWSAMITAIAQTAKRRSYSLLIISPGSDGDLSVPIETALRRRNVDGFIVGAEHLSDRTITLLEQDEAPFVLIGRNPRITHYGVDVDNVASSERLVACLTDRGYKRIACLAGPAEYQYTQERVNGYRAALKRLGQFAPAEMHTDYSAASTRDTARRLAETNPDFDALYITAGGDFILDIIDGLRDAGRDIGCLGFGVFDDYRFFDYLGISIIAIRQPLREIGTATANMLFQLLEGKEPEETNRILPTELILR